MLAGRARRLLLRRRRGVELVEARRRGAAVRGRDLRRAHVHVPAALRGRPGGDAARARARRPARRDGRDARVRRAAGRGRARRLGALGARRPPARRPRALARLGPSRRLPRRRASASFWARLPLERLLELWREAGIEDVRCRRLSPRRRHRRSGAAGREREARPAFYALAPGGWRDYVTLLHPPYTLWHLSYVVDRRRARARTSTPARLWLDARSRSSSRSGSARTRSTS